MNVLHAIYKSEEAREQIGQNTQYPYPSSMSVYVSLKHVFPILV